MANIKVHLELWDSSQVFRWVLMSEGPLGRGGRVTTSFSDLLLLPLNKTALQKVLWKAKI